MIIKNAQVYTPEHIFKKTEIAIKDGRIVPMENMPEDDKYVVDAHHLYAIPALVDIHFHGACGYDFCDGTESSLQGISDYEAENGILAICPATMSLDKFTLSEAMLIASRHKNISGADLVGINMEGPFINQKKSGAQNAQYIQKADVNMFRQLQAVSGGLIKLVDIAPETQDAISFIEECSGEVNISLAHTCCDYDTALLAFRAGADHVTHLFNAMNGIHHRNPGPVIAALETRSYVELICDGIHIHPAIVRFTFKAFPEDKIIMISDSIRACGLKNGNYMLGKLDVTVNDRIATLRSDANTLAGSVTNLYECMRIAVREMGVPLELAVRAATENPAKSIGIDKDYGSLGYGRWGNVLLVDKSLNIVNVIQKGHIIL